MNTLDFLPVSAEDMHNRDWWYYDFLVVTASSAIRLWYMAAESVRTVITTSLSVSS